MQMMQRLYLIYINMENKAYALFFLIFLYKKYKNKNIIVKLNMLRDKETKFLAVGINSFVI